MSNVFIDGNEAVARAAVAAGCSFFAGYPITPATSIFNHMLRLLPPRGGICLQGEDEISSIGFCLGASMAGKKVMTATSGPGISLYSEQISFAIGGEIPIVIVDVQRLGPSTGSATKGADGDIQFLRWGASGGLPVIVLAPVDSADCYLLTMHAFNLAEVYRCPVFIASNKEVGLSRESVRLDDLDLPEPRSRALWEQEGPYLPFCAPEGRGAPYFSPIGGETLARQTSSTHGQDGYITIDPVVIETNLRRMQAKLQELSQERSLCELDQVEGAELLLVVYGVTARAARAAVRTLRARGMAVSLLVVKMLYPVPEKLLREQLALVKQAVVIEMNMGQYLHEIERLAQDVTVRHYCQMNGELIDPAKIVEVLVG